MTRATLAIFSLREMHEVIKKLHQNWENFFVNKQPNLHEVRSNVYDSWKRCQMYDVNPLQQKASIIVEQDDLHDIIHNSEFYQVAIPFIHKLSKQIKGTGHLITLSDNKGRIIYLKGENDILSDAEKMNFVIGADWSEASAGTNAIGTAITIQQPLQIWAFEHFCMGVHDWICSASPIIHPVSGQILGVIDLTGPRELAQAHSLSLVQTFAKLIEMQLLENVRQKHDILKETYQSSKRQVSQRLTILIDEFFQVVEGDIKCLDLLGMNKWEELWTHEEMEGLRKNILNNNLQEEQRFLSLPLQIRVQNIYHGKKHIGYQLFINPTFDTNNSLASYADKWQGIIMQSKAMKEVMKEITVVAQAQVPILITGESGTGKELIAKKIHENSTRKEEAFLSINCGAIPKDLISTELFGYERGTFTGGNPEGKKGLFEKAKGGTLLLDEIGEMPIDLQVHLLRVLQEKEIIRLGGTTPIPIDVRIIAATNKDLQYLIEHELFRMDLYFRLNVVEVNLPALRDRKEDIPKLIDKLLLELARAHNISVPMLDKEVFHLFKSYDWPGNVRELRNVLEFAILFQQNNQISVKNLPNNLKEYAFKATNQSKELLTLFEMKEKEKIKQLLQEESGNISAVARRCGIARTTLYRKMKKFHLLND